MIRLDSITDAINKILDKAQQIAPTVWQAALHQVALNAKISLWWGIGWTAVAVFAALVGWIFIPGFAIHQRKLTRRMVKVAEAKYQLDQKAMESLPPNTKTTAMSTREYSYGISAYRNDLREGGIDSDDAVATVGVSVVIAFVVILCATVLALQSYWNAYQMANNPTWWAIQLLKSAAS